MLLEINAREAKYWDGYADMEGDNFEVYFRTLLVRPMRRPPLPLTATWDCEQPKTTHSDSDALSRCTNLQSYIENIEYISLQHQCYMKFYL